MRIWNIIFGVSTVIIVTTMMMPSAFGMLSFTQWGGMYTDGWCNVYIRAVSVSDSTATLEESIQCPTTTVTWSAPMHNFKTCVAWGRSWCDTIYKDEWHVYSAQPYFRGGYPFEEKNICDFVPQHPTWFTQNYQL